jgi:hypothetical protein
MNRRDAELLAPVGTANAALAVVSTVGERLGALGGQHADAEART